MHDLDGNAPGVEGEFFSTGVSPGCKECQKKTGLSESEIHAALTDGTIHYDPWFSHSSCDLCHAPVSGDRHLAHDILNGEVRHLSVCTDCVFSED
jgi:hypothetical protein